MKFPQDHPIMFQQWLERLQNITTIEYFEVFEEYTNLHIGEIEEALKTIKLNTSNTMIKLDLDNVHKFHERLLDINKQLKKEKGKLQKIKRNRYATKKIINRLEEERTEIQKKVHELLTHAVKCQEEKDKPSVLQTELQKI